MFVSYYRKKCDSYPDCSDQSDEINCNKLRVSDYYAKEVMPLDFDADNTLDIYINVTVWSIPQINTMGLK